MVATTKGHEARSSGIVRPCPFPSRTASWRPYALQITADGVTSLRLFVVVLALDHDLMFASTRFHPIFGISQAFLVFACNVFAHGSAPAVLPRGCSSAARVPGLALA